MFNFPVPSLQIGFSLALVQARGLFLQEALGDTGMAKGGYRDVIAMEIKGGKDFSNIHNRLGEAEKSHQKARAAGFTECWTVVNVSRFDLDKARRESPSTDRFYRLSRLEDNGSEEYQDFRERIISLTGIRG